MNYYQLKHDIENSASIRSLRANNAPLIFSFLHHQFKQKQQVICSYQDLVDQLDTLLDDINGQEPNSFPRSAKQYLTEWARELGLLRIYNDAREELVVELTSDAERSLRWLEDLNQRSFIGTESRFLNIFTTLNDIVVNSTDDPEERLANLQQQIDSLQREMEEIRTTGRFIRLTDTQIRERYALIEEDCRRLLSDFAAIADSFRSLASDVQQAALRPSFMKGEVLGNVLDADLALENSDEGRSFRAFWQFLQQTDRKEQFTDALTKVYELPELREVSLSSILPTLTRRLLDAGQKIIESNQQLADQLRRILDERAVAESQRVQELCGRIKQLAYELATQETTVKLYLDLETDADIRMPMERALWSMPVEMTVVEAATVYTDMVDLDTLHSLYNQFYVDERRIEEQIALMLDEVEEVTLASVLEAYPPQKGVAEVLAYVRMASNHPYYSVDEAYSEAIHVPLANGVSQAVMRVPLTTFRRKSRD